MRSIESLPRNARPARSAGRILAGAVALGLLGLPAAADERELLARLAGARGSERVALLNALAREIQASEPARSIEYAEEAAHEAGRAHDRAGLARALNNIGIGHYHLAEYDRARDYYERSLAVAEDLGDEERIADALNNIGILHYVWGEYEETLRHYHRVLEMRRRAGDRKGLAAALNNLGNVYYATGRYAESLDYYSESLPLYEALGEERMVASTLDNLGLLYLRLERRDDALRALGRALGIQERLGDPAGTALTLANRGLVLGALGRLPEARADYERALVLREQIGDRQGMAICRHQLGRLHGELRDHARGLALLHEAAQEARRIGVRELERDVEQSLAEAYEQLGRAETALAHFKRFKQLADALLDEETSERLAEWQARYEVRQKDGEIEVLRKDQEMQRLARNVTLGGAVGLVLVLGLLYNRYRLKSRANLEMHKANEALRVAQAEREKAARAELEHVSRVAVLGEMATSLAHELNQPLTAIRSNAQAARRLVVAGRAGDGEVAASLADIAEGAGRAGEIIRRLRELLRQGEIARAPLDVNEIVGSLERILRADAAAHGATLELALGAGLPAVSGDRIQLQQVLLNLVHNGAEAMRERTGDDRRLVVRTWREGERVAVEVRDHGPPVEPAVLARMFDPFFTTKTEGMGMGLPICASIVEAHGGTLRAAPCPDGGLALCFDLPRSG